MAKASTFSVSVVTPEGAVLDCEATAAVFPAFDGEVGILPNHAPLLAKVGIGVLRVTTSGETKRLFVDGGFAQVVDNRLSLLTEQARPLEDLDPSAVEGLFEKAREITGFDDASVEARDAAYARARVQRRLARSQG